MSTITEKAPRRAPGRAVFRSGALRASVTLLLAGTIAGCSGTKEPENPGTAPRMRIVTTEQYLNTIDSVFGNGVALNIKFPPLRRTDGLLSNGAALAGVTSSKLELFQRAAQTVAGQVVDPQHRDFLIPCVPADEKKADDACAKQFFSSTGRLLQRRKLTDAELDGYVKSAGAASNQLKDFYVGLELTLESMLISPEVLFVVETSEKDPDNKDKLRLDSYSLASRLSYFLWNAAPDDRLLKAAESGELQTKKGLTKVVDVMLQSPRVEAGARAFFDDMFAFDDFDSLSKDATVYPFFTGATVADAREQTLRTVVDHLITKKKDYRDLFTTRDTFMSPALAPLYQIPASKGWTPYEFPENSPRQGLLTQVSFLAVHAHPGRSSPTRRGKALRELLLCQVVPPPPPNVDFGKLNNPDAAYKTQRERVNVHLEDPVCAGCHKITDPMGLALESFDGAGRFREEENGAHIDTSGELDGKKFGDVAGLGQALHDNPGLPACLVNRVYAYGTGGATAAVDRPLMGYLTTSFQEEGYKYPDLLRTIALSDAFSHVQKLKTTPAQKAPEQKPADKVVAVQPTQDATGAAAQRQTNGL